MWYFVDNIDDVRNYGSMGEFDEGLFGNTGFSNRELKPMINQYLAAVEQAGYRMIWVDSDRMFSVVKSVKERYSDVDYWEDGNDIYEEISYQEYQELLENMSTF